MASSSNDASGNKSVSFAPEERYYDSNNWYALSKSDKEKVIKAHSGKNGGEKASNSGGHSKSGGGCNIGKVEWKSKIKMLEKKMNNQKRQLIVFNTVAKPCLDNKESEARTRKREIGIIMI